MQDDKLHIAVGDSATTDKPWRNTEFTWPEFVERLSTFARTSETEEQYAAMSRPKRGKVKDVGGYVGGYLANGKRNPRSVTLRSVVTLDVDKATLDTADAVLEALPYAFVLHSTHSHTAESPRYRLILPLSRAVSASEYVPIARRLAEYVGIEMFDETGYQPFRLMFWPSCSKDAEYIFIANEGDPVPVDLILDTYVDYNDVSAWPTSKRFAEHLKRGIEKQKDPLEKPGVIGAFCRTYDIHEAIEKFLPHEYTRCESSGDGPSDRYTYAHSSTAAGLIVYDNKFTYCHHGTDPTSNLCCNAYDLVRIHKFGDLDNGQNIKRSMAAMDALAYEDTETAKTMAAEQLDRVKDMFSDATPKTPPAAEGNTSWRPEVVQVDHDDDDDEPDAAEWMATLDQTKQGKYLSSARNLRIIFDNDERLCGTLKRNLFDSFPYVFPGIPWRIIEKPERMRGVDYAGLRAYIEIVYGISSTGKVDDALAVAIETKCFHPVRDYLNAAAAAYDGKERIKSLLPMYLGTESTTYTAEAMKTWLMAGVARIFNPGCKFDLVLTLVGSQGAYKSTFFSALAGEWFSDTFTTFKGNAAYESLMGSWIVEMGELSAMNRSTVEAAKQFIASTADKFRPAYGRTVEVYPRQCIIGATTNEDEFLTDNTGNRRFLPVYVDKERALYNPFDLVANPETVLQLWGEAVKAYRAGGKLYLTGKAAKQHQSAQERHQTVDSRLGVVTRYLDMYVPQSWDMLGLPERRMYFEEYGRDDVPDNSYQRTMITPIEIWTEAFKNPAEAFDKIKSRDITAILKQVHGWAHTNKSRSFGRYGRQRYYERK